ncbi:MAG: arginine--tRNA ligase [bacterium]
MDPFIDEIAGLIARALEAAGLQEFPPTDLAARIGQPPDETMGDYAFPCFPLAKALRKPPPKIAAELAETMSHSLDGAPGGRGLVLGVEAAGPYLNFRVDVARMAALSLPAILDGSYFAQNREAGEQASQKVMVEYSQPNTHKAFHVGHLRNVALGDALARIMAYNGHEVIPANYIGDVGTHIARCLWFHQQHRHELEGGSEPPPADPPALRGEWLGMLYTAATRRIEDAAEKSTEKSPELRVQYNREVSEVLQALESGEGEVHALWRETRQWSLDAFDEIYHWLGARFDHVFYESEMEKPGRQAVEDGLARGVFVHSEGAVGVELEAHGLGFLLVLKGDGTTLYSTKDLALAEAKFDRFGIEESIYVVGAEQTLHFRQVFKTLELLGYRQAANCHHLAYGLVTLPEGKMSSRAGNVILFSRLRGEMNDYIMRNYLEAHRGDWSDGEIEETARRIAVAAIRYGMVKQDPTRSIVFNMEDWLVSEGNTGTYLCYAYTRIMSVLRQVGEARGILPDPGADTALLAHDNERALIRALHDFNRVAARAAEALRPNLVANALYQLCQNFSRAYTTCSVLHAESDALARARLALFAATGVLLKEGLALIGIVPPERM